MTEEHFDEINLFVRTKGDRGTDPLRRWGHPMSRKGNTSLPEWIMNCGDLDTINKYMEENFDKLNPPDTAFMMKRVDALEKAAEKQVSDVRGPRPKVEPSGKNHAKLLINQDREQSSGNGCWSCAMEMMLKSRGITNVNQEDIRAYRPPLKDKETILKTYNKDDNEHYNVDQGNELYSMSDAILAFAPDTMVHEIEIDTFSEDIRKQGISRAQYNANVKKTIKDTIMHAINVDKSPVSIWKHDHYVTVTEIKGDMLYYKDSNSSAYNADKPLRIDEFITGLENQRVTKPVQLTWVSDIKLAKDGKTIYDVPSTHVSMNEDGTIKLPPAKLQTVGDSYNNNRTQAGVTIARLGEIEDSYDESQYRSKINKDGVIKKYKCYLPKKLNADRLRQDMENRTNAEERRLAKNSNKFYGTLMPKLSKDDTLLNTKSRGLLDAPDTRRTKETEDILDSTKISSEGLDKLTNEAIGRREETLRKEWVAENNRREEEKAARNMPHFLKKLSYNNYIRYNKINQLQRAMQNAMIPVYKNAQDFDDAVTAAFFVYCLGKREMSLAGICNLDAKECYSLGNDFIKYLEENPIRGEAPEVMKKSLENYGKMHKKAVDQLRQEGLTFPTEKDMSSEKDANLFMNTKFGLATLIALDYPNVTKGMRTGFKIVDKSSKEAEGIDLTAEYLKGYGDPEQYAKDFNYINSIGCIGWGLKNYKKPHVKNVLKSDSVKDIAGQKAEIIDNDELIFRRDNLTYKLLNKPNEFYTKHRQAVSNHFEHIVNTDVNRGLHTLKLDLTKLTAEDVNAAADAFDFTFNSIYREEIPYLRLAKKTGISENFLIDGKTAESIVQEQYNDKIPEGTTAEKLAKALIINAAKNPEAKLEYRPYEHVPGPNGEINESAVRLSEEPIAIATLLPYEHMIERSNQQKKQAEEQKRLDEDKKRFEEEKRRVEEERRRIEEEKKQLEEEKKRLEEEKKLKETEEKEKKEAEDKAKKEEEEKLKKEEQEKLEREAKEKAERERKERREAEIENIAAEKKDIVLKEKNKKLKKEKAAIYERYSDKKLRLVRRMSKAFDDSKIDSTVGRELENKEPELGENYPRKYYENNLKTYRGSKILDYMREKAIELLPDEVKMETLAKCLTKEQRASVKAMYNNMEYRSKGNTDYSKQAPDVPDKDINPSMFLRAAFLNQRNKDFIEKFYGNLPDNHAVMLLDELQKFKLPDELKFNDQIIFTHNDKIAELKNNTLELANGDEKEKKRLDEMLDRAGMHLYEAKNDVKEYYSGVMGKAYNTVDSRQEIRGKKIALKNHTNDNLNAYTDDIGTLEPVPENAKTAVLQARAMTPPKLTPKYRQGLVSMFDKFDAMFGDMSPEDIETYVFEESTKVYANRNLVKSRIELSEAVNSGNIALIEQKLNAYEKDLADIKELQEMSRQIYADSDPYHIPGNLDTLRNSNVPFEISKNVREESRVNSAFQLWMAVKKCGVSLDEFLADPGKFAIEKAKADVTQNGAINELKKNPFHYALNASRIRTVMEGKGGFGVVMIVQRGTLALQNGDPDENVKNEYSLYNALKLNECKRYYMHEAMKMRKIEDIFKNPVQNKDKFTAIAGGLMLDAGADYDWKCGFPLMDEKGFSIPDDTMSFRQYLNKHPETGIVDINRKIYGLIDEFNEELGKIDAEKEANNVQKIKAIRDMFLYGVMKNCRTVLAERERGELGYQEMRGMMEALPNLVDDNALKQEMNEMYLEFADEQKAKDEQAANDVVIFKDTVKSGIKNLSDETKFLNTFGTNPAFGDGVPVKHELEEYYKFPVPEGFTENSIALLCLGASMDEKLLAKVPGMKVNDARVLLTENAIDSDLRDNILPIYPLMLEAREKVLITLNKYRSADENAKNEARAEMDAMYSNLIPYFVDKTGISPVMKIDGINDPGKYMVRMLDEAITSGNIRTDDFSRAKIHAQAEQIRAAERVLRFYDAHNEILGPKSPERSEKIADMLFDLAIKNCGAYISKKEKKFADKLVEDTYRKMGHDPYAPEHAINFANHTARVQKELYKNSLDPVSGILATEGGREKLKALYINAIKNSDTFKVLDNASGEDFEKELVHVLSEFSYAGKAISLYDYTEVDPGTEEAENIISSQQREDTLGRLREELNNSVADEISGLRKDRVLWGNNNLTRQSIDHFDEILDSAGQELMYAFGPKANIGDNCTSKNEYDAIELAIPENLDEETVMVISLGNTLEKSRLGRRMTNSAPRYKAVEDHVAFNQNYLIENITNNDRRMPDFSKHLLVSRKETAEMLNDYTVRNEDRPIKKAIDNFIDMAYGQLTGMIKNHVERPDSAVSNQANVLIKLAAKMAGNPPFECKGSLNEIQMKKLKAYAAGLSENERINEILTKLKNDPPAPGSKEREELVAEYLIRNHVRKIVNFSNEANIDAEESKKIKSFQMFGIKYVDPHDPSYSSSELSDVEVAVGNSDKNRITRVGAITGKYNISPEIDMVSEGGYYDKYKQMYLEKVKKSDIYHSLLYGSGEVLIGGISNTITSGNDPIVLIDGQFPEENVKRAKELNEKYKKEYEHDLSREDAKNDQTVADGVADYFGIGSDSLLNISTLDSDALKKNVDVLNRYKNELTELGDPELKEFDEVKEELDSLIVSAIRLKNNPGKEMLDEYKEQALKFSLATIQYKDKYRYRAAENERKEKVSELAQCVGINAIKVTTAYYNDLDNPVKETGLSDERAKVKAENSLSGGYGVQGFYVGAQQVVMGAATLSAINDAQYRALLDKKTEYENTVDHMPLPENRIPKTLISYGTNTVFSLHVRAGDEEKRKEYLDEIIKNKKVLEEHLKTLDATGKKFANCIKSSLIPTEFEKGSFTKAVLNNQYLGSMSRLTQMLAPKFILKDTPSGKVVDYKAMEEKLTLNRYERVENGQKVQCESGSILEQVMNIHGDYIELFDREFERQQLEKEGWNPENEKKYLEKLKKSLEKAVTNFNTLKDFVEANPGAYAKNVLQNNVDEITEISVHNNRGFNHMYGQMKGQIRAIENGWGVNELHVLGFIEEAEAELTVKIDHAKKGYHAEDLNDYTQMKEKLDKLREDCWFKKVDTPEQKLEIIGKLESFAGEYLKRDDDNYIKETYNHTKNAFAASKEALNKEIVMREASKTVDGYAGYSENGNTDEMVAKMHEELLHIQNIYLQAKTSFYNVWNERSEQLEKYSYLLEHDKNIKQAFDEYNQNVEAKDRVHTDLIPAVKAYFAMCDQRDKSNVETAKICEKRIHYPSDKIGSENLIYGIETNKKGFMKAQDGLMKFKLFCDVSETVYDYNDILPDFDEVEADRRPGGELDAEKTEKLKEMLKSKGKLVVDGKVPAAERYLAGAKGKEEFNEFCDALKNKYDYNISVHEASDTIKAEIRSFAFSAAAKGTIIAAKENNPNYSEKIALASDYIHAIFNERENEKCAKKGEIRNFIDYKEGDSEDPKHIRFSEEVLKLSEAFVKNNPQATNFGELLEANKDTLYDYARQIEHTIDKDLNRKYRSDGLLAINKTDNRPPVLDEAYDALYKETSLFYGQDLYRSIRKELYKLNKDIKKADELYATTGAYPGADLAKREKELLERMDQYIQEKEDEGADISIRGEKRLAAMESAKALLKDRYEFDKKCENITKTDLTEMKLYEDYIKKSELESGPRIDRTPAQIINDSASAEAEYRELHARVIDVLKTERKNGNAAEIDQKIAREKNLIYKSAFRSVFIEGMKERFEKGMYNNMSETELVRGMKNGFDNSAKEFTSLINSPEGRRITSKLDSDIKKHKLDHVSVVKRVDDQLSKKVTRGDAEKDMQKKLSPAMRPLKL
ncbi:MAG: hypothetical protein IKR27_04975 [Lachnospiraceae bacterium]|nr:hypothetical protein [Lachnospiraceae bacterium]